MNLSDLHFLTEFEKTKNLDKIKLKTQENKAQNAENKKSEKVYTKKVNLLKDESKKNNLQNEELPDININDLEDKDLALSYYDQLTKEELSRLEHIVEAKYNQNMTKEQIYNLVIQYIAEKKLYDHQRFLPK